MYHLHSLLLIFTLVVIYHHVESARILAVMPTPSYSHQVFFRGLWRALAHRGHEMVVMTPDPARENITNLKEIDISSAYSVSERLYQNLIDSKPDPLTVFNIFMGTYFEIAEHEFTLPQVRQIIDDPLQQFDVVMIQSYNFAFYGLPHRFKAPFISLTSLDVTNIDHIVLGNAAHSVLYPSKLVPPPTKFTDRLGSFFFDTMMHLTLRKIATKTNELNRRLFGDNFPDFYELKESIDLQFINNNPLFSAMRPLSPNTISIAGGFHLTNPGALPRDLQQFLDESPQGVVYFSLGSNVKSKNLPKETLAILMETFNQLPYNILWKFENDLLPGKPNKVKIMKWVPQQQVLRHQNVKLFITQAGMQSLDEALFARVPLIVIPIVSDQTSNALKVVIKGVALQLNVKTLTVEEFKKTILEVINNPTYKNNMITLAKQIGDQPMTALERAIWWTEYIIRHKSGQHLKGPKIPLYQYFYLDIWAFLIGCLLAVLAIVYFLYLRLFSLCKNIFLKTTMKFKKS